MLSLLYERWTFYLTMAAVVSLAMPYFVRAKRDLLTGMFCSAVAWQIAILDAALWINNSFRELGTSAYPPRASETYNVLVTAPLSLAIPLLVLCVTLVTMPQWECKVRRISGIFFASCCVSLADLIFLVLYISQLAMSVEQLHYEYYLRAVSNLQ